MTAAAIRPSVPPPLDPTAMTALQAMNAGDDQRIATARTEAQVTIAAYRAAAGLAHLLYKKPIARLVSDQLLWWCEIGHRLDSSTATAELYEQVMADAREAGLA